ncbi:hypothetical protein LXA43DRAFT_901036, partial [Ganoderma leucocontextum]
YFPGTFNGTHFTPVDDATRFMEFGKGTYAAQFFYGTPDGEDGELAIHSAPDRARGWRGAMKLPKCMFLTQTSQVSAGWNLVALPVDPGNPVFNSSPGAVMPKSWNRRGTLETDLSSIASGAFVLGRARRTTPYAPPTWTPSMSLPPETSGRGSDPVNRRRGIQSSSSVGRAPV